MGPHNVKLVASQTAYGSVTYVDNICVNEPTPATLTMYISGGTTTVHRCNDLNRTFYLFHPPASDNTKIVTYTWQIKTVSYPYWVGIAGAPNAGTINFTSPLESYDIKCIVSIFYIGLIGNSGGCPTACQPTPQETPATAIAYVDNSPCP